MSPPAKPSDNPPVFVVDKAAALKGGEVAGQYLDAIGKTDLASLNAEQWGNFCFKLVGGALLASIGDIYDGEPPF